MKIINHVRTVQYSSSNQVVNQSYHMIKMMLLFEAHINERILGFNSFIQYSF